MSSAPRARSIGAPGIALVVIGAVLVMLSFTAVSWYGGRSSGADSVGRIDFGTLHQLTGVIPGEPSGARWYFSWLAWVLLLLGIAVGFAANLPIAQSTPLRVAGLGLGLLGVVATYYALHKLFGSTGGSVFDHAQAGVWMAFAGYLVIGLGAAVGPLPPRRVTSSIR